ncbi:hypothetical protein MJO28_012976 [Puccinia striiformis f. sp. tritici]|uniref:Uncharacterized protein n=4 Tax=Puccinia striiformis TaxID=27350 RepID=A0A0L0V2Q4_9BASI|nr:hypothetical protein Pst134EA_024542 [Puccinia striiformis f. sp. tritici]KAI9620791.1 hypothetical protein H4Q26_013461 [Puccinia striiformis f. sp. tritici PST-130]KNE93269.1 hypothetical protein PSTG_13379 [Puccinia striiformis f. sp. tritici PST-78]POW16966.1 hypothetical protein PSTT_00785 [Puccinia striiformis]KAH9453673.1 hypothetical protein Pst134EA_024542 [Puccinia striiformis f. sp. tritici]KAI7940691.1 hypothetical protein MJO28_012976 [Puccinia striiformis f. sp. tritici]
MFASSIDSHPFQEQPRNSSQLQSTPQTRLSITIPNISAPTSSILDMAFNRRSLDWSELRLFSPHSTCSDQRTNLPTTDGQSTGDDIHSQLSRWNFPSQPSVPPRLVLWGPFNKTERCPPQFQRPTFSPQPYYTSASYPVTPPAHGCKAPKRGREGHPLSACAPLFTPPTPSKRPRTAEKDAYEFPPPPSYTAYQFSAYPTPLSSPNSQSSNFYNSHPMAEDHLSISPFSTSYSGHPHAPSPTDCKTSYLQDINSAHYNYTYGQLSHPSSSTYNYGYFPHSPISPTTSFPPSPFSTNSSSFPASSHGCHQLNSHNPQYPNIWSQEWHQTFNQFRYQ